jgi:hypothetical protein
MILSGAMSTEWTSLPNSPTGVTMDRTAISEIAKIDAPQKDSFEIATGPTTLIGIAIRAPDARVEVHPFLYYQYSERKSLAKN